MAGALQVEAVLEGLREVLQALHASPQEPTATEYFAAALTALASEENTHVNEVSVAICCLCCGISDVCVGRVTLTVLPWVV